MRKQTNQLKRCGGEAKIFEQTFHQRRYTDGKWAHEKMFYIIIHWGNVNQNHTRNYYTPIRMAELKKYIHMYICVCVYIYIHVMTITQPTRFLCPWNSAGKSTGVSSHSLLQGIFLTQGLNPELLHHRQILYHLGHQGGRCGGTLY